MAFEIVHSRIGSDIWANARLRIIRKLVRDKGKLVLDLGCGKGYVGKELGKNNDVVFAEIDAGLVKDVKGMKVILDARKMPFRKDTFDYVICADVLEHIKEDKKALKNIYDILKKGGRAVIALPAYPRLYGHHDKLIGHYRRYSKREFIKMAEELGFQIKYARYSLSFLFFPFLANQFMIKSNKAYVGKSSLEKKLVPLLNIASFIEANIKLPFGLNMMFVLEK